MGYVKDYYFTDPSDYNEEYFYALQDEYEEYQDVGDFIENDEQIEKEYNCVEIAHIINLIERLGQETAIAYENATAALKEFLDKYEQTL